MTRFQKILGGSFILMVLGGVAGIYLYRKAPKDITKMKAEIHIDAHELLRAYELDEREAAENYTGKVIKVMGTVQTVQLSANNLNVVLSDAESFFGVNCSFVQSQQEKLASLTSGDTLTVKGLCKGYIDDVILTQCTLEQP
ncbi:MAG: hypothetical protein JXR22_02510 [Prolixibacteraceae bacterium]|nr:hypothetical protein [Prolixibacteraceae bacterium]